MNTSSPLQGPLLRANSGTPTTPRSTYKMLYSTEDDVTLLLEEKDAERILSQNSFAETNLMDIEEENNQDWQLIEEQDVNQLELLNTLLKKFRTQARRSNQIKYTLAPYQ